MNISSVVKGIGGEPELNRAVGAFGAVAYVVTAVGLVVFEVVLRGQRFDLIAFCAAFPGGLGIAMGAVAGAVALKDRHVATARVIAETGAIPAPPPAGPRVRPAPLPPAQPSGGAEDASDAAMPDDARTTP